ncbi:MAG: LysR family transcriptional regulator [Pseudomonadota bacterium]
MPKRRLPPMNALRAFEAVARRGSVKEASEELFVTPAAVSQQLRKLEDDLGVTLFVRRNRELEPTREGLRLKKGLASAFSQIRQVTDAIRPRSQENCIVVACDPPFASKFLAPRLSSFLEQNRELDVRVVSDFDTVDHDESNVDVGIHLAATPPPDLFSEALGEEQLLPLSSSAYAMRRDLSSPPDISSAVLLDNEHPGERGFSSTWDEWMVTLGLQRSRGQRVIDFGRNADQAMDAAIAGAGVVLGRSVLAHHDVVEGRLVCPFGPLLSTGLYYFLSHRAYAFPPTAIESFGAWLRYEMRSVQALESKLLGIRPPSLLDSGFPTVLH